MNSLAAPGDSSDRLRLALEGSGLALWDMDVPAGRIYLSATWAALLGEPVHDTEISPEELLARVPAEEQPAIKQETPP